MTRLAPTSNTTCKCTLYIGATYLIKKEKLKNYMQSRESTCNQRSPCWQTSQKDVRISEYSVLTHRSTCIKQSHQKMSYT